MNAAARATRDPARRGGAAATVRGPQHNNRTAQRTPEPPFRPRRFAVAMDGVSKLLQAEQEAQEVVNKARKGARAARGDRRGAERPAKSNVPEEALRAPGCRRVRARASPAAPPGRPAAAWRCARRRRAQRAWRARRGATARASHGL
jgi:hypothetical protein